MLNLKYATFLLFFVLIGMAMLGLVYEFPLTYFIIPLAIYLLLIFYGSYNIQSGFFMEVACKGDRTSNEIAITFDDGPHEENTDIVLDILRKNNIPATFFCIGVRAAEYPDLIRRIYEEGHIIGNHSYSHHFFFDLYSRSSMVREIRAANKIVEKTIGKRMLMFRPPYGVTTPGLAKAVKEAKITPVGWSLRSMDTMIKDPARLVKKIDKQLQPGDVLLLHDTQDVTADSLQQIIDLVKQKGYKIVRLDQLLKLHHYA